MRGLGSRLALLLAVALTAGLPAASRAEDGETPPAQKKPCHEVKTSVQYRGLGYQHLVTIRNSCDHAINCTIKASSNPDSMSAQVEAKAVAEVVVNSGSAASEFSADVQCK
jgi:hypothetical protein